MKQEKIEKVVILDIHFVFGPLPVTIIIHQGIYTHIYSLVVEGRLQNGGISMIIYI